MKTPEGIRYLAKRVRAFSVRLPLSPVQVNFAFAVVIGAIAGLGAFAFKTLIIWVESLFSVNSPEAVARIGPLVILVPALGGLIVGPLIYLFAKEARGQGVAEVIEAVIKRGGRIRPIVAFMKILTSAITLGTGGSAGSEGPIVQIGAGFGSTVGQLFRMPPKRIKTFLACGAAAGISAIFNTPFGGIMFALEVVLHEFRTLNFIYVAIASVVGALLHRSLVGNIPLFDLPSFSMASGWEIAAYLLLGVFAAFTAKFFILILMRTGDLYSRLKIPEYLKPMTGGLAVGLLAYLTPLLVRAPGVRSPFSILSVGYETIGRVMIPEFYENGAGILVAGMLALILLKIVATSFTIGSGGSGGVFAPSLFIGAMLGGIFGIAVNRFFPGHTASPAVYALVGMGATFNGAAHAPISTIFIIFELTNNYEIVLPIIAAVTVSNLVAYWIKPISIFGELLRRRGIDFRERKKADVLHSMIIREIMITPVQTVHENTTLAELAERAEDKIHSSLPVLNEAGEMTGILTYRELHQAVKKPDPEKKIREIMITDPVTAYPGEPVDEVFKRMKRAKQGFAPVLKSPCSRKVVGLVTYSSIFTAYEKAVME